MKNSLKDFSESAKGFTKSPLGIIALFIVLVYGFASLVVSFGQNLTGHITPLIYFSVIFPVIVFFGFLWLVCKHHKKLYGFSDFQDEENFLKMQMSTVASLAAESAKNPEKALDDKQIEHQINSIIEMVAKAPRKERKKEGPAKILWWMIGLAC
ncbi:MAG: hypothetical protein ACMUIU_06930 [bacterium]